MPKYPRLQAHMACQMKEARKAAKQKMEKTAETLHISPRSYSDLENARSLCSAVTFIRFLLLHRNECETLLNQLEQILKQEDLENNI